MFAEETQKTANSCLFQKGAPSTSTTAQAYLTEQQTLISALSHEQNVLFVRFCASHPFATRFFYKKHDFSVISQNRQLKEIRVLL